MSLLEGKARFARILLASLFLVISAFAQTSKGPEFEVASVKLSPPSERPGYSMRGGPGTNSPGQITYTNATLRAIILKAWDLKAYQLTGPATLDSIRLDIVAKIPEGTTPADFLLMLQHLLADRIALSVHHEQKEMTVYNLVIAKGGLKMKEAETGPGGQPPPPPAPGPAMSAFKADPDGFAILPAGRKGAVTSGLGGVTRMSARMFDMPSILELMERHSGSPVMDKTGLTGAYDFKLAFDTASSRQSMAGMRPAMVAAGLPPLPPPPPNVSGTPQLDAREPAPDFMSAIVKQLGLKLEPAKGMVDVLTIDGFKPVPTDN